MLSLFCVMSCVSLHCEALRISPAFSDLKSCQVDLVAYILFPAFLPILGALFWGAAQNMGNPRGVVCLWSTKWLFSSFFFLLNDC